jgi:hypothetical protein
MKPLEQTLEELESEVKLLKAMISKADTKDTAKHLNSHFKYNPLDSRESPLDTNYNSNPSVDPAATPELETLFDNGWDCPVKFKSISDSIRVESSPVADVSLLNSNHIDTWNLLECYAFYPNIIGSWDDNFEDDNPLREERSEDTLKKGSWQQSKHIETYGFSFSKTKYFKLILPDEIIKKYINKFFIKYGRVCDIYEFGVYTGGTLSSIKEQLTKQAIYPNTIWGFDSFEGLPKESKNKKLEGKHWKEGAFSACDALGIWNWPTLEKTILKTIAYDSTKLIKGFYQDVLNSDLFQKYAFKPAMFINIDVDLYTSTIDALEWLFKYKIVQEGTLIRYDDIFSISETEGEIAAHYEMCQKYKVESVRLSKEFFLISKI